MCGATHPPGCGVRACVRACAAIRPQLLLFLACSSALVEESYSVLKHLRETQLAFVPDKFRSVCYLRVLQFQRGSPITL